MVFGALVVVFVFSGSKLLMPYGISCPLWSSVYEWQRVEFVFHISGEDSVWYVCDVLYVSVRCFCSARMCCLEEVYNVCNCIMLMLLKCMLTI